MEAHGSAPYGKSPAENPLGEIRPWYELASEATHGIPTMYEDFVASHRDELGRVGHAVVVVGVGSRWGGRATPDSVGAPASRTSSNSALDASR